MRMIWATRGRSWGFRFLDDGGFPDPLPEYERAFSAVAEAPQICERRVGAVAVRFADPQGRRDAAGRVIPHSFVVFGPDAEQISTIDEAIAQIWPVVAQAYDARYGQRDPAPLSADPRGAPGG